MGQRVKDGGASEGRPGIRRRGVEPPSDFTPPERVPTCPWGDRTADDREPAHFRATDADRAGQYALALRALRRHLPGVAEELRVPLPAAEVPGNRSFLADCFAWLFGTRTE
jgi:hypothetical protein